MKESRLVAGATNRGGGAAARSDAAPQISAASREARLEDSGRAGLRRMYEIRVCKVRALDEPTHVRGLSFCGVWASDGPLRVYEI